MWNTLSDAQRRAINAAVNAGSNWQSQQGVLLQALQQWQTSARGAQILNFNASAAQAQARVRAATAADIATMNARAQNEATRQTQESRANLSVEFIYTYIRVTSMIPGYGPTSLGLVPIDVARGDQVTATGNVVMAVLPGGVGRFRLMLNAGGKVASEIPHSVPPNWSREVIEEAVTDLEQSIAVRRAEVQAFDAVGGGNQIQRWAHNERIVEEQNFLRQLRNALQEMR